MVRRLLGRLVYRICFFIAWGPGGPPKVPTIVLWKGENVGNLHAAEFAEAVKGGDVSLDAALTWHLHVNHYPAVPLSMVAPCREAIEAARDGRWDEEIDLPDGVSWKGQPTVPVYAIVEQHHLNVFLSDDDEEVEHA